MALNSMNILKCTQPVGDWIYSMLSLYKPFLKNNNDSSLKAMMNGLHCEKMKVQ